MCLKVLIWFMPFLIFLQTITNTDAECDSKEKERQELAQNIADAKKSEENARLEHAKTVAMLQHKISSAEVCSIFFGRGGGQYYPTSNTFIFSKYQFFNNISLYVAYFSMIWKSWKWNRIRKSLCFNLFKMNKIEAKRNSNFQIVSKL